MKPTTPFLRLVADCFVANESDNLIDYCFVMPNKRSGVFLTKYFAEAFAEADVKVTLLPQVMTISDFISGFTDGVEASRIEQLLILYNVYSEILTSRMTPDEIRKGKNLVDFNKFQYWGDILLNDFNDVDRFVVDARQLFRNVENLKEISANYLTEEQIEVIRRYWNDDLVPEPVKEFWNHIVHVGNGDSSDKKNVAGFIKLWQVMYEIYIAFRQRMKEHGMTYSGMAYRDALEAIEQSEAEDFPFKKYVFVGFNVLSKSERDIFDCMRKLGIADFYWDYASPSFGIAGNRASMFMKRNVKDYPSYYDIGTSAIDYFPDVEVVALPSTFGQSKAIPEILKKIYPDLFDCTETPEVAGSSLVDTAIVLPDEGLVQPILASMPSEIPVVNVTMGYTLRHTTVASLLKNIISLQLRARDGRSVGSFFYEDVVSVLSHPLIRRHYWQTCNDVLTHVNQKRMFNIPSTMFDLAEFSPLRPIFEVVSNANDPDAVSDYLSRLLKWLENLLEEAGSSMLEMQYVRAYRDSVIDLRQYIDKYLKDVFLEDKTVFHLVERIAGNQSVNYEGVPLEGLQIMGVLEARCLDFENLIITSMNERVFPRKHYAKTFIPNALRSGYGMSTVEHQECIYAYYFYRMISRCKKVWLLYDARTTGLRVGGMSRYISQIKYQFPAGKVRFHNTSYQILAPESRNVVVEKTPEIMSELERFRAFDNPRMLSASALNEYINCPVKFYLSHIERYYEEDEIKDYLDEGTYGTIVHDVVEKMYLDARGENQEVELTDELLDRMSDERLIGEYLTKSIRKHYLHLPEDSAVELEGDAVIYHKIMCRAISKMYKREKEMPDSVFFVKGEEPQSVRLKVSDRMTINLTYRIDRVDRVESKTGESFIRLIDYKTGDDNMSTATLEALFDSSNQNRAKAVLQLMLYSNAYAQRENYDGVIQPYIYKLRRVAVDRLKPLSFNRHPINDYREINDGFMANLDLLLDEMFDPSKPFVANPSRNHCKYCKFQEICSAK